MTQQVVVAPARPFDPAPMLATLLTHAVPSVERVDVRAGTVTRLLDLAGRSVPVTVALTPREVTITCHGDGTVDVRAAEATVRRWFDLDSDPGHVHALLGADDVLGPMLAARPGLRVLGHPVFVEAAVGVVLGQQVSVAAGRTFATRLVAALGTPGPEGLHRFPTAQTLAATSPEALQALLGVTHGRARTVHALARLLADGLLPGEGTGSSVRDALLAVPGIGPWTVETLALRVLGDRDAFPAGDLVLQRVMGVGGARAARERAAAWAPVRAYAAVHLWAAAAAARDPASRTSVTGSRRAPAG